MSLRSCCALAALFLCSCATAPQVRNGDRRLSFGCGDVVVVASIRHEAEEPAKSNDDLLGHSWFTATLNVKRVLRGREIPSKLRARYYAHASFRQDLDFMLVLKRTERGYEVTTGQLMWLRPFLASHCSG